MRALQAYAGRDEAAIAPGGRRAAAGARDHGRRRVRRRGALQRQPPRRAALRPRLSPGGPLGGAARALPRAAGPPRAGAGRRRRHARGARDGGSRSTRPGASRCAACSPPCRSCRPPMPSYAPCATRSSAGPRPNRPRASSWSSRCTTTCTRRSAPISSACSTSASATRPGAAERLEALAELEVTGPLVRNLTVELDAALAWARGKPEEALARLERARPELWFQLTVASPFFTLASQRFLRARLLERAGPARGGGGVVSLDRGAVAVRVDLFEGERARGREGVTRAERAGGLVAWSLGTPPASSRATARRASSTTGRCVGIGMSSRRRNWR